MVAKVAVSAAVYSIDKPYDYLIPPELESIVCRGSRVLVPFGRGNKTSYGIVLGITDTTEYKSLKPLAACPDKTPALTEHQIKLAHFMRERFFCTFFDAARAILPSAMWFDEKGKPNTNDQYIDLAVLNVTQEEAEDYADSIRRRRPKQAEVLDMICSFEMLPMKDLLLHCSTNRTTIRPLLEEGMIRIEQREIFRSAVELPNEVKPLPLLNAEQNDVFNGINTLAHCGSATVSLLEGVTGSGKTSVYVHLIKEQLDAGKSAILLVPEIALTPQMIATFASYFGKTVAVLHSSLTMGARHDEWKRIARGDARLVIGTRSAVFAPVVDPGIIIIDEFHDDSYSSESSPRYNAIDVAKYLCVAGSCALVLGSASPDVVSRYYAETGRYKFFRMSSRYNQGALPSVDIVDMKEELKAGNGKILSRLLVENIRKNLDAGEQTMIFLNRRGSNKLVCCGECGYTYRCPKCSVTLTYHGNNHRLICHQCGYSKRLDSSCPDCGGKLMFVGAGTQQIEDELTALFPDISVLRVDADTVNSAGSHEALFSRFREEKMNVMVGTQMIIKGHNFEDVTLVGVVDADQGLYSGDYRASERCFSTIMQVIGRSGRAKRPGRAIIQTYTPQNSTIQLGAVQDYEAFYTKEIEMRKLQNAPPFTEFTTVAGVAENEARVIAALEQVRDLILGQAPREAGVDVWGPVAMNVSRVNNKFRYKLTVSGLQPVVCRKLISGALIAVGKKRELGNVTLFASVNNID